MTGKPVPHELAPRREGDPAALFASSDRAKRELGWRPRFEDLDVIVETAWRWRAAHPHGYATVACLMSRLMGQLTNPLLSVVMPAYNEQATIEEMVRRTLAVPLRIELIIVDDGSKDDTRDILARLSRELPIKVILQPANGGKGAALRRGFQEVTGDLVIIQDADLEYSPEEFPQLIALICEGRADVVYGSRFLGRHRVFMFTHYAGNRFLTLVANVLYNTMLSDMETCYKVMRTEVLRSMTLESDGFGIEPELTAKIFKRRYRVYEVPITYDGRGYDEGKKITWLDGFVALWVLVKYRFTE